MKPQKLSTDSYKGVRDFFPEDMAVQKRIFSIWRNVAERYGYEEYAASVLEPADLYRSKTSQEIVNEQTYTFKDRGEREVTLRPEMTPTLARMVASRRRELTYPLRWYSIPNLFRYEQPQRGRVREHWQLNVDVFGIPSTAAEIEVISIAADIMRSLGPKDSDFEIRLNSRKVMDYVIRDIFGLDDTRAKTLARLIDRKDKMPREVFEATVSEIFSADPFLRNKDMEFITLLDSQNFEEFVSHLPQTAAEHEGLRDIRSTLAGLEQLGITNARFDQTLMRGFDYYTGVVFEIYDLNPANRRSVFGGGRYDELLSLFGNDKVTAVGFGTGDVIARDLMETYGTLPTHLSPADIAICVAGDTNSAYAMRVAASLRDAGIRTIVDLTGKKLVDQVKAASKRSVPKLICIGDEETKSGMLRLKDMSTGDEDTLELDAIITRMQQR